jgi:hypothetical protein
MSQSPARYNSRISVTRQTRQTVVATSLIGTGLIFVLLNRPPGPAAFVATVLIGVGYLLTTLARWRGSFVLGILALAVLLLAMFWEPERPWAGLIGLSFAALNILEGLRAEDIEDEESGLEEARSNPTTAESKSSADLPINYGEAGGPIESGGAISPPLNPHDF